MLKKKLWNFLIDFVWKFFMMMVTLWLNDIFNLFPTFIYRNAVDILRVYSRIICSVCFLLGFTMSGGPYNYNYIFKYIIIGDMGVGKSCLLHQFTEKKCKFFLSSGGFEANTNYFLMWKLLWICFSYGKLPAYDRGWVWHPHYWGRWAENQTTDLGYR